jgi:hypothetical protein
MFVSEFFTFKSLTPKTLSGAIKKSNPLFAAIPLKEAYWNI